MTLLLATSDLEAVWIALLVLAIPSLFVAVGFGTFWLVKRRFASGRTMGAFDGDSTSVVQALHSGELGTVPAADAFVQAAVTFGSRSRHRTASGRTDRIGRRLRPTAKNSMNARRPNRAIRSVVWKVETSTYVIAASNDA